MMDLSWIGEIVPMGVWRSITPPPSQGICTCVMIEATLTLGHLHYFLDHRNIGFPEVYKRQRILWNSSDGPAFGCTRPLYQYVVTFFRWTSSRADGELLVLLSRWAGILGILMLTEACHIALRLDSMLRAVGAAILTIPLNILTKLS